MIQTKRYPPLSWMPCGAMTLILSSGADAKRLERNWLHRKKCTKVEKNVLSPVSPRQAFRVIKPRISSICILGDLLWYQSRVTADSEIPYSHLFLSLPQRYVLYYESKQQKFKKKLFHKLAFSPPRTVKLSGRRGKIHAHKGFPCIL